MHYRVHCPASGKATQQNPLLIEVDTRIEESTTKIEEAKAENKKSLSSQFYDQL